MSWSVSRWAQLINKLVMLPGATGANTKQPGSQTESEFINFKQSENQRKRQLLQFLALVMFMVATSGFVSCIGLALILKEPLMLVTAAVEFGAGSSFLLSMWLNRRSQSYYNRAAWLVVATQAGVILFAGWLVGTQVSLVLSFVIPILLAAVLLNTRQLLFISSAITGAAIFWYLSQDVLGWLQPGLPTDKLIQSVFSILIILIIIPATVGLVVLPARSQFLALKKHSQRLEEAFAELAQRQQASQVAGQQVLSLAMELTSTATQQASGSQQQAVVVSQVDSSVCDLAEVSANIANLAGEVNQAVSQAAQDSLQIEKTTTLALEHSQVGMASVGRIVAASEKTATLYQKLLNTMTDLAGKNARIRMVLDLINSIANQTHLLALNAAIEAAGAGQYGERFRVVAHEVRQLAQRSAKAGQEVVEIVQEIETATRLAVASVDSGYYQAQELQLVAEETGNRIEQIRAITQKSYSQATVINQTTQKVQQVAQVIFASTAQQKLACEQVAEALRELNTVAVQTAGGSTSVSITANQLEALSHSLNLALVA